MSITVIDDKSPYLESVKALWRVSSDTLGYLPDGAFLDYASQHRILVAVDSSRACVGYLLYRVTKDKAKIAHLCIADCAQEGPCPRPSRAPCRHHRPPARHRLALPTRFPCLRLVARSRLRSPLRETGRAADGSDLTYFWLGHGHRDLFTQESTDVLDAVIDSNVFVDLAESRKEESQGLLADWLQDSIRLCLTVEHYNEFNRSDDRSIRDVRRKQAAHYQRLEADPAEYRKAKQLLAPLFPNLVTPQDKSDFRHLVAGTRGWRMGLRHPR